MPLVRDRDDRPDQVLRTRALGPDEAADLVVEALIHRPVRVANWLGRFGQAGACGGANMGRIVLNTAFRTSPGSAAARGANEAEVAPTADQIAFA